MIKCPTHSPFTASKMSNCAIITLEGESALTHPPPHGQTHTPLPSHMHMLTHPPPACTCKLNPTRTHQCNHTAPAVLCGRLYQCHLQNDNNVEAESLHG
ncbi:hypothetical protein O181_130021 [Austropuccinia psidii MF-1]|uniref:Uncharacterized protein n=1 Tax=Austropuccinia psidii MF-1 TaxID=1389203 RepID=A0A9Q3L1Z3_9BASI|nr:hypothetical protein [Austropuccinia psidii MF-1]